MPIFTSGTKTIFHQSSAPTGWTKETVNFDNHALRVITGASTTTGGSVDFTTAFSTTPYTFSTPAPYVTGSTTLQSISATTFNLSGSQIDSAWTSYNPTWTAASSNPVLNNGTMTGSYKLIGKTCFVRGRLLMGTTTTYGTGAWYIGLPFAAASDYGVQIPVSMLDNGLNWYSGLMNGGRFGSTTVTEIQWQNTSAVAVGITSTVPFTWGNLDELSWNGSYEIA
jgi:hypothetical protein